MTAFVHVFYHRFLRQGLRISIFIFTLGLAHLGFTERTLSVSQWVNEMQTADNKYVLDNAQIVYNPATDTRYNARLYKTDSLNYLIPIDSLPRIYIRNEVELRNVRFVGVPSLQLYKVTFSKKVAFEQISAARIYIDEAEFFSDLLVENSKINRLTISVSTVNANMEISDNEIEFLTFNRNVFRGNNNIYDDKTDIVFNQCKFLGPDVKTNDYTTHLNVGTSHGVDNQLKITNCYFKQTHPKDLINLGSSKFTSITFIKDTIDVLLWMPFMQTKAIYFAENQFNNIVDFTNVSLPMDDSNIRWKQLSGKIVVNEGYRTTYRNYKPYAAKTDEEISNGFKFSELIASYSKFYNLYKSLSDAESANECYIEMKDLETRRFEYVYHQTGTSKAYFDWKVNEFLRYFCMYGTDPTVSVIIAIKVIIFFSLLYFFIPTIDDNLKKHRMLATLNRYIIYTTTYHNFSDIRKEEQKEDFEKLESLRMALEELTERVPPVINLIGKPFYWFSMMYYKVSVWLMEVSAISSEVWYKLPPKKKLNSSVIIALRLCGFVLGGFFMRCLNALTLSLICFMSLGYGEMSPKGSAKYFTALQGVIGWFLLSIFSVTLIGQILN